MFSSRSDLHQSMVQLSSLFSPCLRYGIFLFFSSTRFGFCFSSWQVSFIVSTSSTEVRLDLFCPCNYDDHDLTCFSLLFIRLFPSSLRLFVRFFYPGFGISSGGPFFFTYRFLDLTSSVSLVHVSFSSNAFTRSTTQRTMAFNTFLILLHLCRATHLS